MDHRLVMLGLGCILNDFWFLVPQELHIWSCLLEPPHLLHISAHNVRIIVCPRFLSQIFSSGISPVEGNTCGTLARFVLVGINLLVVVGGAVAQIHRPSIKETSIKRFFLLKPPLPNRFDSYKHWYIAYNKHESSKSSAGQYLVTLGIFPFLMFLLQ